MKSDGTVWQWNFFTSKTNITVASEIQPTLVAGLSNGVVSVDASRDFQVAVASDRSLVAWGPMSQALMRTGTRSPFVQTNSFVELNSESVWRDAASVWIDRQLIVGMKRDGSLWMWRPHFDWSQREAPVRYQVKRLGHHSDWLAVESEPNDVITLAADGSIWRLPNGDGTPFAFQLPSRRPEKLAVIGK